MNSIKRSWILLAAIAIITGIAVSGCGGSAPKPAAAAPAAPSSQQAPVTATQPPDAREVASRLGGQHFTAIPVEKPSIWGIVDQGNFWIGQVKYTVETFMTTEVRNARIKIMTQVGIVPKWTTPTAVTYLSIQPGPPPAS